MLAPMHKLNGRSAHTKRHTRKTGHRLVVLVNIPSLSAMFQSLSCHDARKQGNLVDADLNIVAAGPASSACVVPLLNYSPSFSAPNHSVSTAHASMRAYQRDPILRADSASCVNSTTSKNACKTQKNNIYI